MLRTRLFYGLLTLILLLWGVGAAALLLVHDSNVRSEERLRENYPAIKTARGMRTVTSTVNTHYLPALAAAPDDGEVDRSLYDEQHAELLERLNSLRSARQGDAQWADVVGRLDLALKAYFQGYDRFFGGEQVTRDERAGLLEYLSSQTQRITELSEGVISLAENKMLVSTRVLSEESAKNTIFVATLVMLGTSIAVLIYFQLVRHLVDPVIGLKRSIEEIRKGNFELSLPESSPDSEFRAVTSAFNDMAAELHLRRGETDERLMRTNLVNRAILEAIPSPVFVLGEDGRILQVNPAAEALTENLGVSNRLPAKIQRILDETVEAGSNHLPEDPREALLFRVNEREYYYLPRIFRFTSDDGIHSGRAVLLHNVTRIRWLDDMKTNLISTVSHEIKTPLTGIRMVLHLLLEERSGALTDVQKTMVNSASSDCERLLVTLNTLLDLSRAESGTTHLDRQPTSMAEVVARVERLFLPKTTEKNLSFRFDIADNLPDVHADPLRLDEVMNNLVSNAFKHSPEGGTIILKVARAGEGFVRASVIDEGPGVPEASQSRVFERFFRAPGQETDGVGLGLFISREIMRAHEGRIGLLDRADNKTEFYIDVPLA
ncbi:ATP-binding protein [Luteolibacter marinus]|uniref:ATP-binding protein n=1 Tax=Luteolibacter marinus TaxID=2776705 RepID=UPI00186748F4|nr:ATP-binding protein [Luteolibacter marinus]